MPTTFKYVGPIDEISLPAHGITVKRGDTFETDDAELIGKRAKGKPADDDGNPNPDYDPGSGLYAQPDNYEHVAPKKKASS